ncbi:hypothetical protein GCM10010170_042920 [Dactylosporangium salmoneum]|uniref:Uncharacterized protein n=1 Tax=Dactylosporangium salmoneum TaxID=53361 RepID=A0ABP5TGR0_9ACTN
MASVASSTHPGSTPSFSVPRTEITEPAGGGAAAVGAVEEASGEDGTTEGGARAGEDPS